MIVKHIPARPALYLGPDHDPTLVPRFGSDYALRIGRSGLIACPMPWHTGAERLMGLARGAAELSAAVWGRPLAEEPVVL